MKNNNKSRLVISYSGGRTSALMTKLILESSSYKDKYNEIVVIFANTGLEHEETLIFIDKCESFFEKKIIWVEADIIPGKGNGTRHKIVDFVSCSRNGQTFEEMCKKYGIPNQTSMFCTRELKLHAIKSYLRSIGWKKNTYDVAIGIRIDEIDRISKDHIKNNIIYPLIHDFKITKKQVLSFWGQQPFNLNIPEHLGNCVTCWKKSNRKLFTIMKDYPISFEFFNELEEKYGRSGNFSMNEQRVFFRGRKSTKDLINEFNNLNHDFNFFHDEYFVNISNYQEKYDSAGACSESCELF